MYHFEFVSNERRAPVRDSLISIIMETQDLLRDDCAFRFCFVGSDRRDMVTCDPKTNIGYDFDIDLELSGDGCKYAPKEIKAKFIGALDQVIRKYGYDCAENSTRVITIKLKDRQNSRILHSCDFAIIRSCTDKSGCRRRQYIHFNKKQNSYSWKELPDHYRLSEKAQWVKDHGHQEEMRDLYLKKKNHNRDPLKRSQALYAEAVHEICQKHGFALL